MPPNEVLGIGAAVLTGRRKAWLVARYLLGVLALGVVYAVVAQISLAAAAAHHVVSSVWPPSAIALFALVRFGRRFWPGIALGAFLLNTTSDVVPAGAAVIALGNTLEAVVGSYLLSRADFHRALDRVRDVLALAVYSAVLSTMIAATIGVTSLAATGGAEWRHFPELWLAWWSGDAVGVIVFAPLLFTWTEPEHDARQSRFRALESVLAFTALAVATEVICHQWAGYIYLIFPITTLIALRLGRRGAATAGALVMAILTWNTVRDIGPFVVFTPLGNLFALQMFLVILTAKCLIFAAARSEALRGQQQARASELRYRRLASNLPDACVVLYDRDLRVVLAEGPAVLSAGFTKEQVEGVRFADIFEPAHAQQLEVPLRQALAGHAVEFEFEYNAHTYLVRVLPLDDSTASLGMALAVDITHRQLAQREIAENHTRLKVLSRRLLAAQEEERRRVAREVHDELGQALTGIKIGLGTLRSRAQRRSSAEVDGRIQRVSTMVDGAIEAVKRIILRLRPGVLDNLGPVAALEWEAAQFTQTSGIDVSLNLPREPLSLDGERSTTLYRTMQEALTNVVRHANATSVNVDLSVGDDKLVLEITDDGCGISDSESNNPRSMGILGMRERAVACGGALEVRRATDAGTRVVLTLPWTTTGAAS